MREFQVFEILYGFLSPDQQRFFRKISLYRRAVDAGGLTIHEPDDNKRTAFIRALNDYGLLQFFSDSEQ